MPLKLNQNAIYDSLLIGNEITKYLIRGFTQSDIHLFAYLACLMSLYSGKPVSDWGYIFTTTPTQSPFSVEIANSLDLLIKEGYIIKNTKLIISDTGKIMVDRLGHMSTNKFRTKAIIGSTQALMAIPPGIVREGLHNEPEIGRARSANASRSLLNNDLEELYQQFKIIKEVVGEQNSNLMMPSVAWLSSLAILSKEPIDAGYIDASLKGSINES